jgi:hypothetical protein
LNDASVPAFFVVSPMAACSWSFENSGVTRSPGLVVRTTDYYSELCVMTFLVPRAAEAEGT